MTAPIPSRGAVVQPWDTPADVSTAGSLYALPPESRPAAAALLHARGHWVHVDVLTAGGQVVGGVAVETLAAVRAALPAARVEVHVIELGAGAVAPAPDDLLERLLAARPQRLVLPPVWCAAASPASRRIRRHGGELWAEVAPGVDVDVVRELTDAVDGVLVMLIQAGTREAADLSRLETVRRLAEHLPVGVDGGVRPEHTAACLEAGAVHLVSGRALLQPTGPVGIPVPLEGAR
jgi:pentose-5-phosphate-3-epimerase